MNEVSHVGSLPAGKYYLGDPCYVIADELWSKFCDALDEADPLNGVIFKFEKHQVFVSCTNYGDGRRCFDNLGNEYGSIAGIIGLIPIALCEKAKMVEVKQNPNMKVPIDLNVKHFDGLGHLFQADSSPIECSVTPGRWVVEGKKIQLNCRVIVT
jgi:hypothetical protein